MQADGRNTFNRSGVTSDIIDVVMDCYRANWQQCHELAQRLRGATVHQTARNIYDYILANVNYNADPSGVQWVRTPARLLTDGTGDCKSFSILAASILKCLNINAVFRFVAIGQNDYHHVYVIAEDNTIIDPCPQSDGQVKFNFENKARKFADYYLFK